LSAHQKNDQQIAHEQFKKRRLALKLEKHYKVVAPKRTDDDDESSDDAEADLQADKPLAKSKYQEDLHILGHTQVWGSWYITDKHKWGFGCCQCTDKSQECTHVVKAPEPDEKKEVPLSRRARRRAEKRAERDAEAVTEDAVVPDQIVSEQNTVSSSTAAKAIERVVSDSSALGDSSDQKSKSAVEHDVQEESLVDEAMLKRAVQRRSEKRQLEVTLTDGQNAKSSSYLGDLLSNPI